MTFDDLLARICDLLQRQGRVSYWALQRRFDLSANDLEGLKVELIEVQDLATDLDGKMLVWTGSARTIPAPVAPAREIGIGLVYHARIACSAIGKGRAVCMHP
jgi:hypothetical protein